MNTVELRHYAHRCSTYLMELSLGDEVQIVYDGWWKGYRGKTLHNCVFVKVTPKGFNILDLDTNRTILKRHIYAVGMTGKAYPTKGPIRKKFVIPFYIKINVKLDQMEKAS